MAPKLPNNEVKETERQHYGGKMVADWDNLGQEETELAMGYSEVLVRLPTGYTDEWKSVVGCFKRRCTGADGSVTAGLVCRLMGP